MKSLMSVVVVLLMASFCMAQGPGPKSDKGPKGVKGPHGKVCPGHITPEMREAIQKRMEMMKKFRGGERPQFEGRRGHGPPQMRGHHRGPGRGHGMQHRRGHGPKKGQQSKRGPQRCEKCKDCPCQKK